MGNGEAALFSNSAVIDVHADVGHFTLLEEVLADEDVAQGVLDTEETDYLLDGKARLKLWVDDEGTVRSHSDGLDHEESLEVILLGVFRSRAVGPGLEVEHVALCLLCGSKFHDFFLLFG